MTPVFFLPPLFLPHLWNLRRSPCRPPAEILRFDRHQSRPRTRVRSKNGVPQKEVIARLKSRKAKRGGEQRRSSTAHRVSCCLCRDCWMAAYVHSVCKIAHHLHRMYPKPLVSMSRLRVAAFPLIRPHIFSSSLFLFLSVILYPSQACTTKKI